MKIIYNDSDYFNEPDIPMLPLDIVYVTLVNITSFCSILGCLATISCFWMYPGIRTTSRKLLVYVSIADFVMSISAILQVATYYKSLSLFDQRDTICQASSFLVVYSNICAYLWTIVISFYLFLSVSLRLLTIGNKLMIFFHIFGWIMPGIVVLSATVSDIFGYDMSLVLKYHVPVWCLVSDRVENQLQWHLMSTEGWALAALLFCLVVYITLTIGVWRQKSYQRRMNDSEVIEDMAIQTVNKQLRFIPAAFCVLRFWGCLYFMVTKLAITTNPHDTSTDWILIMKGFCDNSQGLVNFVLFYLTTKQIKSKVSRWFRLNCNVCWLRQKQLSEGHFSAPKIFRVRGKYQRKRRLDELDLSEISLDLPSAGDDHSSMMEDEVVFERD